MDRKCKRQRSRESRGGRQSGQFSTRCYRPQKPKVRVRDGTEPRTATSTFIQFLSLLCGGRYGLPVPITRGRPGGGCPADVPLSVWNQSQPGCEFQSWLTFPFPVSSLVFFCLVLLLLLSCQFSVTMVHSPVLFCFPENSNIFRHSGRLFTEFVTEWFLLSQPLGDDQ